MILQGRLLSDPRQAPRPGWLRVSGDRIVEIGEGAPPEPPGAGGPGAVLTPGFVDAHVHLPQIDAVGYDGRDLFRWLEEVIFPAESRWRDPDHASAQCAEAYRRMVRSGTLAFAGFLTSHPTGAAAVRRAAATCPLRAIAGQVLMDRGAPDHLLGHERVPLDALGGGRVTPSVNPRFAVSCSPELLERARQAAAGGAIVHTHLAETRDEVTRTAALYPDHEHVTAVFDRAGLLGPRTLLAHGVHLGAGEWAIVAERGAVVVHCPSANVFLRAGLFDLDAARGAGARIALGSDVAAGCDLAMPRVARSMIEVAKMRACALARPCHVPGPAEAWALITRGNAEALGFDDGGRLEVGAAADLLVLEPPFDVDGDLVGRLIYTWRDEYITARIVAGTVMGGSDEVTE